MLTRRGLLGAGLGLPFAQPAAEAAGAAASRARRIPFGSASMIQDFRADPRYRAALTQHCDIIAPMNDLKWEQLRHDRARFDYADADEQVAFARDNGKALRGHTLLWGEALPPWVKALSSPLEAERHLVSHIHAVVGRYRGVIGSWDVVNEVIAHDPAARGPWRETLWQRLLGPRAVEIAFRTAAEADPGAKLVIADYDFENPDERTALRRRQLLDIVKRLKDKGIPVHGVGFQAHLYGEREIDRDGLSRFVADIDALGLDVLVTELDVIDWRLPAPIITRDAMAAKLVKTFLDAVVAAKLPSAVLTWGLSDRYSWIIETFRRGDGLPVRPLPFDGDYRPKPMWRAIEAFCAKA